MWRVIADRHAAAVGAFVAGELAARALQSPSPLESVAKALIDTTPGPLVDVTVATAEAADKRMLRATLLGAWAVAGPHAPGAPGALAAAAGLVRRDSGAVLAGIASSAVGMLSRRAPRRAVLSASAAALAVAVARHRANEAALRARRAALHFPTPVRPAGPVPPDATITVNALSPLHTPAVDFYVTDVTFVPPRVDPQSWRLRVTGMVDRPLELSWDELCALGLHELDATLVCVHNPVGGPRIGSGRWLGVPVHALLERAGVQAGAEQLVARSVDGFTAGVPLARVAPPHEALVAVGLGGAPLPVENGFPARLLVPGLWGADANTKWLTELEVTTWAAVCDYWDRRGWPRRPSAVRPGARIDVPARRAVLAYGSVTLAGVAWAPPDGVSGVEVAVGDGPWMPAELSAELAPTLWRQWRLSWDAPAGDHVIRVRCRSRSRLQAEHDAPPYPVGSSGIHAVKVRVVAGAPGLDRFAAVTDDVKDRMDLALSGLRAWRERGYPPAPRWPAVASSG